MEDNRFSFIELIRHFWKRRYLLIVLPPVLFVAAYFFVRGAFADFYEASAMLRVRTAPSELRVGPTLDRIDPPVYEEIFRSDALLREVVDAARDQFPSFPRGGYEHIKSRFRAEVIMTRETAVVAEFSPVVKLSVEWTDPEQVHFLAETWLVRGLGRYGDIVTGEAENMSEAFRAEFDRVVAEVDALQASEAEAAQNLAATSAELAAMERLLYGSPARLRIGDGDGSPDGGLLFEEARLLGLGQTGDGALERVRSLIVDTRARIAELNARKIGLTRQLEAAREELLVNREALADYREILVNLGADGRRIEDSLDADSSGDLSILSRPIVPEVPVSPPRALYTVMVAILLIGVLLVALIVEFYVRAALRDE